LGPYKKLYTDNNKTNLFSLGFWHWKRFWLECTSRSSAI